MEIADQVLLRYDEYVAKINLCIRLLYDVYSGSDKRGPSLRRMTELVSHDKYARWIYGAVVTWRLAQILPNYGESDTKLDPRRTAWMIKRSLQTRLRAIYPTVSLSFIESFLGSALTTQIGHTHPDLGDANAHNSDERSASMAALAVAIVDASNAKEMIDFIGGEEMWRAAAESIT